MYLQGVDELIINSSASLGICAVVTLSSSEDYVVESLYSTLFPNVAKVTASTVHGHRKNKWECVASTGNLKWLEEGGWEMIAFSRRVMCWSLVLILPNYRLKANKGFGFMVCLWWEQFVTTGFCRCQKDPKSNERNLWKFIKSHADSNLWKREENTNKGFLCRARGFLSKELIPCCQFLRQLVRLHGLLSDGWSCSCYLCTQC